MDPVEIQRLVATALPDRAGTPVRALSSGLDNVAYEVGDLIVRVARRPDPAAVAREAALLSVVARVSPLPIPRPVIVAAEHGLMAYPTLPGRPLLDVPAAQRPAVAVAGALGELLAALHAVPGAQLADLVEPDDTPSSAWLAEAAQHYATARAAVPAAYRPAIESFLDAPPPPEPPALVLSHNDLGAEHVLIDDLGTVTGVIDWTDAALADPAHDLGLILRDLGPAALDAALRRSPADRGVGERAGFHARCRLLEDLAYGLTTGRDRYRSAAVASLPWLFTGIG